MPSTNKLASARVKSRNRLAKFLLSFCGIASFGVFTILVALAATFSVSILSNNSVSALSTVSNQVSVTIPGSIALRLLDSTATTEIDSLSFDLTPVASGTALTKRTIVDVATSNPTGYKLYMQSNYQKSGSYTTDLVHTDSSVTDSIPTSTSASTLYWNYNNPLTSTTNPIPAHGTPDKIGQYFSPTNSNQTPLDVNVSVDTSIVSGTYENQLLFSAVGNPTSIAYKLHFNTGSGTMTGEDIEETATAWTDTITIPGDPSTSNYTNYIPTGVTSLFTGWTISIPTGSTTTATCNGTNICHPGDSINITGGINQSGDMVGEVNLTANYTAVSNMQTMTPTICNAATIGAATTLTDTRDSSTYTIRKLKDGNCWMTQNLRLTGPRTLTLANSDVALDYGLTASDDSTWCMTNSAECIDRTMILDSGRNDYGVYYNWYGATAGSGTYEQSVGNATSSICPKGWRLPTSGDDGEFYILYNQYPSSETLRETSGPALVLSGFRNGGDNRGLGSSGYFWSSTTRSSSGTYDLSLNSTVVYPASINSKYNGYTLRCLAQTTTKSVLGVDPNGGTWNGSTKGQTFAGAAGETKTISNPTTGPTYNISFDMSTSGMPAPANTAVARPFTSWSLSGAGSFAGGTYTYGAGNGTLTAQYSTTSNTFTLPSINNGFAGTCKWAEGSPTGTQYNIGASRTVTGDTTYYAVCTMQAMTTSICSNAAIDTVATLTDTRDQNTYSVRKLKDSKCWMTQNLRIVGPRTLTSSDTNLTAGTTYSLPASNSGTWSSDQSSALPSELQYIDNNYGSYYNYQAALAGDWQYGAYNYHSPISICPKNWRLPAGGAKDPADFYILYNNYYDTYDLLSGDPGFVLGGFRNMDGSILSPNSGMYWTDVKGAGPNIRPFVIGTTSSNPYVQMIGPYYGMYIRCLAQ